MPSTINLQNQSRLWTCLVFGYASGLPFYLSEATLKAWYSDAGLDMITIGYLSLISIPYTLKFLWAPLFDRFFPPFAGRRRGWIILFQLGLIVLLAFMASQQPAKAPLLIAIIATIFVFFSASLDIVVDAYRTELLPEKERGMGTAYALGGYRIGMLIAGGLMLIMADHIGWQSALWVLGLTLFVPIVMAWFAPEPSLPNKLPSSLQAAMTQPIFELCSRQNILWLLLFLVCFKCGDAFTASLTPAFLLRELHFSLTEVGTANKIVGLIASILGIFSGGVMLTRCGLLHSLYICIILQALVNLQFYTLALIGHHSVAMYFTLFLENWFVGMGNAAIIALIMALCDVRYTATQFAFFTAVAALTRVIAGLISGYLVTHLGWANFYLLTFFIALPALFVAWRLDRQGIFFKQSIAASPV